LTIDDLLVATSRTFAPGIHALRPELRTPIAVAYLILRVSDFLEDTTSLPGDTKVRLLGRWADALTSGRLPEDLTEALEAADDDIPDTLAARHVARIFEAVEELDPPAREVVVRYTASSTLGMARWVERGPDFRVEADLDDYMHEVAGKVGLLLTELFLLTPGAVRADRAPMMELASEFGLALQTVNVIRGLHEDPERGWDFVPASFRDAAIGEDPDGAVLDAMVRKAERHIAAGVRYMRGLGRLRARDIRFFCALPLLLAAATVSLSRGNPQVFRVPVKLERHTVVRIAALTRSFCFSDRWLYWYCGRLLGS
jgi:farnesyl-diphosphate farnesyltransferase